jgi:hypothetical protein
MSYLIVTEDSDGTKFVLHQLDDLDRAKEKFEFVNFAVQQPDNHLFYFPEIRSLSLYEAKPIEVAEFEPG